MNQRNLSENLPRYVCSYPDRHGKMRYRFRRRRMTWPMPEPNDPAFHSAYQAHLTESAPPPKQRIAAGVYFIAAAGEAIKIGYASDPVARLASHQTSYPKRLTLLGVAPGPRSLELEYHRRFAEHRVRGEWFRRAPEILAEIERLSDAPQGRSND